MKHGPEYKTNGKRPVWLKDGDECSVFFRGHWTGQHEYDRFVYWNEYTAIRLPADHWANAAIEAGYEPWAGGDEAPEDWDDGEVLLRCGERCMPCDWKNIDNDADIIGYKKKESAVSEEVQDCAQKEAGKYLGVDVYHELARLIQKHEPHRKPKDRDEEIAKKWAEKLREDNISYKEAFLSAIKEAKS